MSNVIPHNWDVPQIFRGRLGTHAGRQRTMAADGHLLIILHEAPKPDVPARAARLFWRKPDGTWKSSGSSAANIAALRAHVDEYTAAVDAMEAKVQKAKRASDWFQLLHESAPLLRAARNMSAALQEARDLAKTDSALISIRDQGQDIERAVDLIHNHARSGLDYSIAKGSEDNAQNTKHVLETGHRLNLIAATFLPVTALGSVFSMQLEHGLEHAYAPWVFWGIAAGAFLLGLIVRSTLPKAAPGS